MMRKGIQIVLALILLLLPLNMLLPTGTALACDCSIPENAQEAKEQAAAVLTGTAQSIEEFTDARNEKYDAVTLAVEESWKGINKREVVVYTNWTSCQFDFEQGGRYLLYPYEHDGRYEVSNCGRSGQVTQANTNIEADLKELGAGTKFEAAADLGKEAEESSGGGNGLAAGIGIALILLLLATIFALRKVRKSGRKE